MKASEDYANSAQNPDKLQPFSLSHDYNKQPRSPIPFHHVIIKTLAAAEAFLSRHSKWQTKAAVRTAALSPARAIAIRAAVATRQAFSTTTVPIACRLEPHLLPINCLGFTLTSSHQFKAQKRDARTQPRG